MRLRLFHTGITPITLFGVAIVLSTNSLLKQIDVVQRKMLRSIVTYIHYTDEDWKDTMQRLNE